MLESVMHLRPVMGQYISFSAPFYAFLAAIFLLVFFRMMGLLKRQGRFRQMLVNLYYLYLPLVLVLCASAWMYSVGAERYVITTMEEIRADLLALSSQSMDKAWHTIEAEYGLDTDVAVPAISQSLATEFAKKFVEDGQPLLASHSLDEITTTVREGLILRLHDAISKDMLSLTGEKNEAAVSTLKEQWLVGFTQQMSEGAGIDFLLDEIRYRFITFFKKIQLLFLLLSVPVIIEIGYALYQRPPLTEEK